MTIPADYREFFVAAAGACGALIGLLFVAVSVFPERARLAATRVEYHARASAALLVFTNALVLSLAALIPDVDLDWWTLAAGVLVLMFAASTARLVISAVLHDQGRLRTLGVVGALLVVAGFESSAGIRLIVDHLDTGAIRTIQYVVIGDIAIGVARAWQLVNMRDTGVLASLRTLTYGDRPTDEPVVQPRPEPVTTPVSVGLPSFRLIENLIATYARLVDAGDFAGVGTLLADATFIGSAEPVRGREAVERLFRHTVITYDDGTPRTKHLTTNIAVDVDEAAGTGVAQAYFTVVQALPDRPPQPIVSGRYHDRFARRAGQWHFAERQVLVDLVGDVSHHLRRP